MAHSCRLPRCSDLVGYLGYFYREDRSVGLPPNIDLHDLVERDAVLAPVIKLRGAGGGMRRHLAGELRTRNLRWREGLSMTAFNPGCVKTNP